MMPYPTRIAPEDVIREHDELAAVVAEAEGGASFQRATDGKVMLRDGKPAELTINIPDWAAVLSAPGVAAPVAAAFVAPQTLGPWDTGYITFSGGTPVGGYSQLTLRSDGSYNFTGHFHVSGAPSYNTALVYAVRDANNTVYTFSHRGRVHGTFEAGSRDDDWGDSGVNPALAAGWPALWQSWTWHWNAAVNIDIGALVGTAVQAVGYAAAVIAII